MSGKGLRLFALIIGIDIYAHLPHLHVAVKDANSVEEFLISNLGVSKDRIVNLRNAGATRKAIITAMQDLASNQSISKNDPILIYYAGHGGEASPPPGWSTSSANGKVQMLLPYDFNPKGSKDAPGQGILDMKISLILSEVADKKSDNITVIFDCCHSGSGTRNNWIVRGVELPNYAIPAHLFRKERDFSLQRQKTGLQSHVLLAACESGLQAFENQVHGLFTNALLCLLKKEGINRLSYRDVIMHIPHLSSQTPQCEGVNSNRIIFTADVAKPRPVAYGIRPTHGKSNQFTLEAGKAHDITNGATFAVYSDEHSKSFIGYVVVSKSDTSTSQCSVGQAPLTISHAAYAVQISRPEGQHLRLSIDRKDPEFYAWMTQLIQRELLSNFSMYSVQIVDTGDRPDLSISTYNGWVRFEIKNEICCQNGLTRMPYDVQVGDYAKLLSVLRSASDFYCRLDLDRLKKDSPLTKKVGVECLKLTVDIDTITDDFLVPEPGDTNLNNGGKILIYVGDKAEPYGYRITNNLKFPLYVALFYFDMSNLSIVAYYTPPTANNKKVDFSLPSKPGALTIGFGDGGWPPCEYYLRENQTTDVGFLKLYVSTCYVDYSSICQSSPFGDGYARATRIFESNKEFCATMTIPIVQQKRIGSG